MNKRKAIYNVTILWIILWCANIFGQQTNIMLFAIPLLLLLYYKRKISKTCISISILLIFFSMYYALWEVLNRGFRLGLVYALVPACALLIGYCLIYSSKKTPETAIIELFDIICATMFIYATLNMSYLFRHGWSYSLRGTYDFWTGVYVNATNQGGYLILICVYAPLLLMYWKRLDLKHKLLYIVELVSAIVYTLILGNRTLLLVCLLSVVIAYFYYFFKTKNKVIYLVKTIGIVGIAFLLFLILFNINAFGIKTFWENSTFYTRMQYVGTQYDVTLRENDRFSTWSKTLGTIYKYPIGGKPDGVILTYAHNLWLDIQWNCGWLPFILMVVLGIMFLVNIRKILKQHRKSNPYYSLFVLAFACVIMLEFMVEPIMEGFFYLFVIFWLMFGALLSNTKKNINSAQMLK
jgi:hypothetical protein